MAYLRQCVVNACRSAHRHRAVERRSWAPLHAERAEPAQPEAITERDDERVRMLAALRTLPERQREVLILRYYGHLSEAEIADLLGLSRGAVKTHAHRGLAALRTRLDHEGDLR